MDPQWGIWDGSGCYNKYLIYKHMGFPPPKGEQFDF